MADKLENKKNSQNYIKLTENQIFEKIKKDLSPIQENLSEKKITVDGAKRELKKINEWLQWTNLEQKKKKEVLRAFEKLIKLEKNIDENSLKNEVNEIINLLEVLTKRDLAHLQNNIIKHNSIENRPPKVQEWIKQSSNNLDLTINDAEQDSNPIANWIGKAIKWLNS